MAKHYLRVDAVNMANSVYDTHDISTIRGGSYMLLEAIESLPSEFPNLVPISTAASQGLFSLEGVADPRALTEDILSKLYSKTGGHATFVIVTESDRAGEFPAILERLEAQIVRQQWRRPTVAIPEYSPSAGECYLDGWRPGVVPYKTEPGRYVSAATDYRRERGRSLRNQILTELLGEDIAGDLRCTPDLDVLSAASDRGVLDGKMAMITVDGNGFGAIRRAKCKTPELRTKFDRVIQDTVRTPFLRALVQLAQVDEGFWARDETGSPLLRLEVLLWGGDEFTLIVPAWRGWQTLQLFYGHAVAGAFEGADLTHRAALIFCHHRAPILELRSLAENLLNRTKLDLQHLSQNNRGDCYQERPPYMDHCEGDAAHYLALESFDMVTHSLNSFIKRYYRGIPYDQLLVRASEMDSLRETLLTLRQHLTQSRVAAILRALEADKPANGIVDRGCSLVPADQRAEVQGAIDTLVSAGAWRWRMLADLWDYVPEWRAHEQVFS